MDTTLRKPTLFSFYYVRDAKDRALIYLDVFEYCMARRQAGVGRQFYADCDFLYVDDVMCGGCLYDIVSIFDIIELPYLQLQSPLVTYLLLFQK